MTFDTIHKAIKAIFFVAESGSALKSRRASHARPVLPGSSEHFSTSCTWDERVDRLPKMCKSSNGKLVYISPANENVGISFSLALILSTMKKVLKWLS